MTTYTPAPGTVAFRVIGWLEEQGAAREGAAVAQGGLLVLAEICGQTDIGVAIPRILMNDLLRKKKKESRKKMNVWSECDNKGLSKLRCIEVIPCVETGL